MLVFDEEVKIGDVYRIVRGQDMGMIPGSTVTITSRDGDAGTCESDLGDHYAWDQEWIDEGLLVKEDAVGIVFEEEANVEAAVEPTYGKSQVDALRTLIGIKTGDAGIDRHLRDCINVRYRSKAYRDHINSLSSVHITRAQVAEMKRMLDTIRRNPRTPSAKAYRYEWP